MNFFFGAVGAGKTPKRYWFSRLELGSNPNLGRIFWISRQFLLTMPPNSPAARTARNSWFWEKNNKKNLRTVLGSIAPWEVFGRKIVSFTFQWAIGFSNGFKMVCWESYNSLFTRKSKSEWKNHTKSLFFEVNYSHPIVKCKLLKE
jgi:hypothetical protein